MLSELEAADRFRFVHCCNLCSLNQSCVPEAFVHAFLCTKENRQATDLQDFEAAIDLEWSDWFSSRCSSFALCRCMHRTVFSTPQTYGNNHKSKKVSNASKTFLHRRRKTLAVHTRCSEFADAALGSTAIIVDTQTSSSSSWFESSFSFGRSTCSCRSKTSSMRDSEI